MVAGIGADCLRPDRALLFDKATLLSVLTALQKQRESAAERRQQARRRMAPLRACGPSNNTLLLALVGPKHKPGRTDVGATAERPGVRAPPASKGVCEPMPTKATGIGGMASCKTLRR